MFNHTLSVCVFMVCVCVYAFWLMKNKTECHLLLNTNNSKTGDVSNGSKTDRCTFERVTFTKTDCGDFTQEQDD